MHGSDHQILRDYEAIADDCSALEFLQRLSCPPGTQLQLELIAIEIEFSLRRGEIPDTSQLHRQFGHLGRQLNHLLADTVEVFLREYCPLRRAVGRFPQEVGGYRIEREVGRGGMGVVYEGLQLSLERKVALKVQFFSRDTIIGEARTLAALSHPNICQVYDVGLLNQLPFMAMQYVEGSRLTDHIVSAGPMPLPEVVSMMRQLTDAMRVAHERGIVHRDIKPSNILLNRQRRPLLTDFGFAGSGVHPMQSALLGCPSFCAPESFAAPTHINSKLGDIYSLGAVMFEMLTGRRAFYGTVQHVISQIRHDPPRRPSDYRPQIDVELESICLKAMNRRPEKRFQSMAEFRHRLTNWLLRASRHAA